MLVLGGNIKLDGFNSVDPPTLIVVKKIVGNYAKKINDNIEPFQELLVNLNCNGESNFTLNARLVVNERVCDVQARDENLFFALDRALNKVMEDLQK